MTDQVSNAAASSPMAGDPGTLPAQASAATPEPAAGVALEEPVASGDYGAANSESTADGWRCWMWKKTKCGAMAVNGFKTLLAFGSLGLTFALDLIDQIDIKGFLSTMGADEKQVAIVGLVVCILGVGLRLVTSGSAFSGSGKPSTRDGIDLPEEEGFR